MGCAPSKVKVCQTCRSPPYSPVKRTNVNAKRNPTLKETGDGDINSITSIPDRATDLDEDYLKSKLLAERNQNAKLKFEKIVAAKEELGMVMTEEIKIRSDEKIPELVTPVRTPQGEPETINAWELMEGLEEDACGSLGPAHRPGNYSSGSRNKGDIVDKITSNALGLESRTDIVSNAKYTKDHTSIQPYFDPQPSLDIEKTPQLAASKDHASKEVINNKAENAVVSDKLTVYFTSLRGVRKTYEDCCHVRVILKGLGVKVDEKDVSLDMRFRGELRELLQEKFGDSADKSGLPQVFLGRKYIGGVDEIRQLNEETKLDKIVRNCKRTDDRSHATVCTGCGDIRFVPCDTCSGSCKIYCGEEEEDDNDDDDDRSIYGFRRCPHCNEYGLRLCPICCD